MTRAAVLVVLAGCFGYAKLPPEGPDPSMRKIGDAKILEMDVHLHKQPGLCPGKKGKLYADATVQWPTAQAVPRNIGAASDSLQAAAFQVSAPLVAGDANAHLMPNADVLRSVKTGFDATIVYKPEPRFTFKKNFPPEYSCYREWYEDGATGAAGSEGEYGSHGAEGEDGGHAGHGQRGGRGGNGGRVIAVVTLVTTPYYDKLIAMWVNKRFILAPANVPFTFGATGGYGGNGGNGGGGGNGGDQAYDSVEKKDGSVNVGRGQAGDGGNGGSGGQGGDGGDGGTVEVTYDSRFPELRSLLKTDVSGGNGGYGGAGGYAGSGGGSVAQENDDNGEPGQEGQGGANGRDGRSGTQSVRAGNVSGQFTGLQGVAIYGSPEAMAMQKRKSR